MTPQQKEAYIDCVKYLIQYAQKSEHNEHMKKFCSDIIRKAEFLYSLKPHLFIATDVKELILNRKEYYNNNNEFNTNYLED